MEMRLARFAVSTLALLAVAGCGADGTTGGKTPGTPVALSVSATPTTTASVGASAGTFTVKVVDAAGTGVPGVSVTFTTTGANTLSPSSATTSSSGEASTQVTLGTVTGTFTVTARVTGITSTAAASITAVAGVSAKVVVTPETLRLINVGDTARVTATSQDQYGNTIPASGITFSVVDGTLVSVDATGLVRVLRQGGSTFVISTSGGKSDTTAVTVLPAGSSACTGLASAATLAVGGSQVFTATQYGCVAGTATGAEFVITAFNSRVDSTVDNSTGTRILYTQATTSLSTSIQGNGLGPVPSTSAIPLTTVTALRSANGGKSTTPPALDQRFHVGLLRQAKSLSASLFANHAQRNAVFAASKFPSGRKGVTTAVIPANARVGDVFSLNVGAGFCVAPINHGVRVKAIGTSSIVLADTLNPAGFSDADYQKFATRFDTLVYPLDVGAFGAPSDLDGNGKVAIVFTRTVNELVNSTSGYYVGGFFNPRDLFPKVAASSIDNCAGSNEGEMFYMVVPAPDGINGVVHTVGQVDSITTGILAHEFQHLINAGRRFYINTDAQDFEQTWLNEGLSHVAEELLYYRESGLAPRSNLTDSLIRIINRPTYGNWKDDASANFSRLLDFVEAPTSNSPYADNDDLATRGATWSFLRYAADRLGATDGSIWKKFGNSTLEGFETLNFVFGTDATPLFRDWNVANFTDDLGVAVDPNFTHKSWNYRDIFTNTFLNIPRYPLAVNTLADNGKVNLTVLGGSAGYVRFSVPAGKEGLLTFTSGGGLPSGQFQYVVVRTK
ncbi:MAG: Peptidase hyicolysin [Gemmatimonadetes bacterium]|nr:Peptidase hyicolysin [Gemmatimonadota bacterium]